MKLPIPEEPQEVKNWMKTLETEFLARPDSTIVWYGNKLPQYLWNAWKDELKPQGFTWQKFMKLMRYRTDIIVLWYRGFLPWDDFVTKVIHVIEGPLGTRITEEVRA